jgi:hypothetical protein
MVVCCIEAATVIEDIDEATLAKFFALLAEGQARRPDVWRLPAACLANILKPGYAEGLLRHLWEEDDAEAP